MRGRGGALLLLLLGLGACPVPPPLPPQPPGEAPRPAWFPAQRCGAAEPARERCYKPWTVLVYMAADNDLEPYAYLDLYSMEAGYADGAARGASGPAADLVVALDDRGERGVRRLHLQQDAAPYDARLTAADFQERGRVPLRSPVVEVVPERRPGSVEADLKDFLGWGVRRYPALRYLVVLWGHGEGWTAGPRRGLGGVAFNDTQRTYLDIPALREALRGAAREQLGGRPFDLYAADACLMQTVEVTTEISDAARYLVGSTQVQDYVGLPYRELMERLQREEFGEAAQGAEPGDAAYRLARSLPELYRTSLDPATGRLGRLSPDAQGLFTLSALSGAELRGRLVPALDALGRALLQYGRADAVNRAALQQLAQADASFLGGMHDLGRFLSGVQRRLSRDQAAGRGGAAGAALGRAAAALEAELARAVLSEAHGAEYDAEGSSGFRGVSVWIPASRKEYDQRGADFARSALYGAAAGWGEWIGMLYDN